MREQRLSAREHISEGERLMLIGLLTLAKSHNKALRDIEAAAYSITREVDREGALLDGTGGHTSDALFCDYEVDDLLRRLGLTVQAQGDPAPAPPAQE